MDYASSVLASICSQALTMVVELIQLEPGHIWISVLEQKVLGLDVTMDKVVVVQVALE